MFGGGGGKGLAGDEIQSLWEGKEDEKGCKVAQKVRGGGNKGKVLWGGGGGKYIWSLHEFSIISPIIIILSIIV